MQWGLQRVGAAAVTAVACLAATSCGVTAPSSVPGVPSSVERTDSAPTESEMAPIGAQPSSDRSLPGTDASDGDSGSTTTTAFATPVPVPQGGDAAPGVPPLDPGKGSFTLDVGNERTLTTFTYVPDVDLSSAPVVVAMHGASRNAEGARNGWVDAAREYGLIVVAPLLDQTMYPGDTYNLGGTYDGGNVVPRERWAFPLIEQVFDHVLAATGGMQQTYVLYGHSAGSQFVQKFALMWPSNRVGHFVLANAGWYTMLDSSIEYPYGLRDGPSSVAAAFDAFDSNLLVLVGELDNDPAAPNLRRSTGAQAQGATRRDRAINFFDHASLTATSTDHTFRWRFEIVPGVGHESRGMVSLAATRVFG